jgi:glycosyltransferase involved in cell wall biosynthesis
LLRQRENRGACAKNAGLAIARGRFIVFLDDDSYPLPGAVQRMIRHFDRNPALGAAVFTITLPDGSRECSAYPDVFIGCGTGFRARALREVGGLPEDFFMQAEEYDLSLRLLAARWHIRTFDDLHVAHLKTPTARSSSRVARLDVRNNLTLIFRYFPERWVLPFALDWVHRYGMIAAARGHRWQHWLGAVEAVIRAIRRVDRRPVNAETFETFARINQIEQRLRSAQQRHGLRTVLLVDLGKNVLPYCLAARRCGIRVAAVADQRLGGRGHRYRGTPILTDEQATSLPFDAAVISNLSPVHAAARLAQWRHIQRRPVIDLFEPSAIISAAPAASESRQTAARSA